MWRGATTGYHNKCEELPRVKMCSKALNLTWVDAKLIRTIQFCYYKTNLTNFRPSLLHLRGDHLPELEWSNYRGILDIDGNVNAWGLFWRLASGSVVFKVESKYLNAYITKMVPWVHYIPIKEDLSDFEVVII